MPDFKALATQFDLPEVSALVLMGSYARGDSGWHSDVDMVRFTYGNVPDLPGNGSHLIDKRLVVVSQVCPHEVEKAFTEPEVSVAVIAGLRNGRSLIDKSGFFSALQQRAHDFQWSETLQTKANIWASQQMTGWIEEVHKGLEGLRRSDTGRLLNAKFGCSWGLTRVMCVQRGVLLTSDNRLVSQVTGAVGTNSKWSRLCQQAFGIGGAYSLEDCVRAGLRLYVETAVLLQDTLRLEDAPLIQTTAERIKTHLPITKLESGENDLKMDHKRLTR